MEYDVAVVGSGISGVFAAYLLKKEYPSLRVIILEASDYVGGRLKQDDKFVSWPIDLGAEFIHGQHNSAKAYADKLGFTYHFTFNCYDRKKNDGRPVREWLFFQGEKGFIPINTAEDKDVCAVRDLLWPDEVDDAADQKLFLRSNKSLTDWGRRRGLSERALTLLDAFYAKTEGSDAATLSIQTFLESEEEKYGYLNFRLDKSYGQLHNYFLHQSAASLLLNFQVVSVDYSSAVVTLTSHQQQTVRAKRTLLTVPLTVLQDKDIHFVPALPRAKEEALRHFTIQPALKVLCLFSARFWPDTHSLIFCAGSVVQQVWTRSQGSEHLVTGFSIACSARKLSPLRTHEAVELFLDQLDQMYATAECPRPAHQHFVEARIFDWTTHPFIRGGYSSFVVSDSNISPNHLRKILLEPLGGKVFFAGEALNLFGAHATIHGALDCTEQVVPEIISSLATSRL